MAVKVTIIVKKSVFCSQGKVSGKEKNSTLKIKRNYLKSYNWQRFVDKIREKF